GGPPGRPPISTTSGGATTGSRRQAGASPPPKRRGCSGSSPSRAPRGSCPVPDLSRRSCEGAKADRRFAWWLVRLYPPRFRRDVGLALVDALEDRMRARRAAGATSVG